jgi:type I restriction enzyme M protein
MAKTSPTVPVVPALQLSAVIKAARDIMRKDKGLNGDLDRLPMLTWIMFLKFLDDKEQVWEAEAKVAGKAYKRLIEAPYRWRDWAAKDDGITGEELISFINNNEAVRLDGKRGPGLFAYLRKLQSSNGGDRRDVIATIFKGTINRMANGYLLRDVINKINELHFTQSNETHVLSHLYESLLKEMRDSAGDSGEFYTPRPVVRFIVEALDPQVGETVLDPAAGTGGFLVEAFEHMMKKCKTTRDRETIQKSLFGIEAKSLPYLLCQMNLLLHGVEFPQIDSGNALRFPLKDIGDKDRVDLIMTNPPFGGEEERGILSNFPEDKQTSETAMLFLQLIMRKLRREGVGSNRKGGRCGMVVPNGTLFAGGVCARIKEDLLREFNLHTVVRLPNGVFSPYTPIPTNLMFFDRSGPTKETWYYEHAVPEGRRQYTKTQPLQFQDMKPCLDWWRKRKPCDQAWKVPVAEIIAKGYNLDFKNPNRGADFEHMPPKELLETISSKERRILNILDEVKKILATNHS